jgi:hypothetical protein
MYPKFIMEVLVQVRRVSVGCWGSSWPALNSTKIAQQRKWNENWVVVVVITDFLPISNNLLALPTTKAKDIYRV